MPGPNPVKMAPDEGELSVNAGVPPVENVTEPDISWALAREKIRVAKPKNNTADLIILIVPIKKRFYAARNWQVNPYIFYAVTNINRLLVLTRPSVFSRFTPCCSRLL